MFEDSIWSNSAAFKEWNEEYNLSIENKLSFTSSIARYRVQSFFENMFTTSKFCGSTIRSEQELKEF